MGRIRRAVSAPVRRVLQAAFAPGLASIRGSLEEVRGELHGVEERLAAQIDAVRQIAGVQLDQIPALRRELASVRRSEEYAAALRDPEPLVTVRIATYNRAGPLLEQCLPAVLGQSYERLEVIVVGDGCDDDTADRLRRLDDPRVRFVNLPHQSVYPEQPRRRWQVAGSPAMNLGAQLATGSWIAPDDDDDVFSADHVEVLLRAAQQTGSEMVYGQYWVPATSSTPAHARGMYPPVHGYFGFQAAIYMAPIRFFEYETSSWVLDEPGDWNLCRRMLAAGVRIGYVDRVVTTVEPTGPR